ncbi:DUF2489 domain-containing protein [Marinimicrobium sp. C2-29]|uniref:DUF2489 domain-containing protein n=1 Tax=Marinimicrobium sp. C2-29 TaxID=3139825 RepID=UPI0031396994
MTLTNLLIILAVIIVMALAVVAAVLQYKVYLQKQARQAVAQQQQADSDAQRERLNKSIQILAQSVGSDDLSLTEASIRISVLLDSMSVEDSVREEFAAFYQLAEATSHIPILDAWKELPKKKKLEYNRDRSTQEQFYEKAVVEAAQRIRGRRF